MPTFGLQNVEQDDVLIIVELIFETGTSLSFIKASKLYRHLWIPQVLVPDGKLSIGASSPENQISSLKWDSTRPGRSEYN